MYESMKSPGIKFSSIETFYCFIAHYRRHGLQSSAARWAVITCVTGSIPQINWLQEPDACTIRERAEDQIRNSNFKCYSPLLTYTSSVTCCLLIGDSFYTDIALWILYFLLCGLFLTPTVHYLFSGVSCCCQPNLNYVSLALPQSWENELSAWKL